ncbi:unnamed protein product [Paramecium pentaurelia]|uniref:Transmembrane protein n=1 Tax=Paramecium pentaurelia TaxID=43138 RepID=A0A8S1VV03_9CILI|nr:unnamed protein product [Paramecium pentaurelia]
MFRFLNFVFNIKMYISSQGKQCKECINVKQKIQVEGIYEKYDWFNIPDCNKCVNQSDNCIFCNEKFDLVVNKCICNQGYYKHNSDFFKCQFTCKICISQQTCTQCSQIQNILFLKRFLNTNLALHKLNAQTALLNRIEFYKIKIASVILAILNLKIISVFHVIQLMVKARKIANIQIVLINNGHMENIAMMEIQLKETDVPIVKQIPIIYVSIIYLNLQFVKNVVTIVINVILITQQRPLFILNVSKDNQFLLNVLKNNVYNIVYLTSFRFKQNNQGQCLKCKDIVGLYSNFENNTCYYKCGDLIMSLDEECDDSSMLNGDGCDRTCRLEKEFIYKDSVTGDQSIYNNVRLVQLSYNMFIKLSNDTDYIKDVEVIILNYQEEINIKQYCDITSDLKIVIILNTNILFVINPNSTQLLLFRQHFIKAQRNKTSKLALQTFLILNQVMIIQLIDCKDQQLFLKLQQPKLLKFFLLMQLQLNKLKCLLQAINIFCMLLEQQVELLFYLEGQIFFIIFQILYKYCHIQSILILNFRLIYNEFVQMNFIQKYFTIYDLFNLCPINENFNNIPLKIKQDDLTPLFIINSATVIFIWFTQILIYIVSKKIPYYQHRLDFKYSLNLNENIHNMMIYQIKKPA